MAPPSQNADDDSSSDPSPTDTRNPSRYEPITGRDDSFTDSFLSTDTVRRIPESTATSTTYAITSPDATSVTHADGGQSSQTASERAIHRATQNPARSPMLGPDRGRGRPRKPPMTRRASSNVQAPHRGEVFSVDDGIAEVEADAASRQQTYSTSTVRRRTVLPPALSRVHSHRDDVEVDEQPEELAEVVIDEPLPEEELVEVTPDAEEDVEDETPGDEDGDISDAESFTLKDRQQAINQTHPFGIRLWKPALYKKDRSVQKNAEGDIHSSPGGRVSNWLFFFNVLWTLAFGWWMALIAFVGALICFVFAAAPSGREYGRVLWGLAGYLFYPFGKFVRLEQQEAYLDEDLGEGRSISEYEQWQNGDLEYGQLYFGPESSRSIVGRSRRSLDSEPDETDSLLGRGRRPGSDPDLPRMKRRLFGRGQWNIGRVIFFIFFYFLIMPSLFIVSAICWFLVFWIPMGKVTMLLFDHLRRHPLALSFDSDTASARAPAAPQASILLCTYRAVGLKYWKYTVDGTNIFLINLMAIVCFVIFDWLVLDGVLHVDNFLTSPAFLFIAALMSIIPLAYFIGQAVASISAQSSMGLGAAINAFFSTIVEVFLYCVALKQGKAQLVEGSIVGSIFAGILFLPGLSMCCGAIKRKTQRFNSQSAGVTSTMLLFAVIGAFGPTLFYQIYGTHELTCQDCTNFDHPARGGALRDCRRCYFSQTPALNDRFYLQAVRPYCYIAAGMLFLSYAIGLWFTLRTHAAVIWNSEADEKKQEDHVTPHGSARPSHQTSVGDTTGVDIRDSHLYKRILGQSLRQVGHQPRPEDQTRQNSSIPAGGSNSTPHVVPPKQSRYSKDTLATTITIPGFSDAENNNLVHQVTEIAATAAAVAARNVHGSRRISSHALHGSSAPAPAQASVSSTRPVPIRAATFPDHEDGDAAGAQGHGGHDAPNWSRLKSAVILMGATILYAVIAEILVDTVDVVLESIEIDEKFLGITLFALVPNTTEFLNAISFAMNGNIALSMEIGSAYALQVCLLQIPALVLFSAVYPPLGVPLEEVGRYTFTLLFPQWDMVTVILCVFLLSYMYGEGKSNYFKGSILLLSYLVVIIGYYFSGFGTILDNEEIGTSRFDTLSNDGQWLSPGSNAG
ncbi:Sodium/calcium exchanger protein-domain-containing protein [Cercophora scortea]|uniref:Sodium/calcium exchanger protein-domain-containing protein n=1 Tax=Cercophora scortea TaxID=314031 RepID=A0AAE0IAE8_9PEZI|nr:Sodium/calcium exchanger protein-domain-containing protein [Cercophora scortea]